MMRRASRRWSPGRASAVASLFMVAFAFGGIWVGAMGVEFVLLGVVDGLAALLIIYVLLNTEVLSWPKDAWGVVVLAYGGAATAQLVSVLLPPPGVLEWLVLGALAIFAWSASYGVHRTRIMLGLGLMALTLAVLKYSMLPFVWSKAQLPQTPIVDLHALGEGFKGLFVAYEPSRPVTQAFALAAIVAWVVAVWLQWPPEGEGDWLRRLSRRERDQLLSWLLLTRGPPPGRELTEEEVRGSLDRGNFGE